MKAMKANKAATYIMLGLTALLLSCKGSNGTSGTTTNAGKAWVVTTLAGDSSTVEFKDPEGVAVDSKGNIYVADTGNHRIRKITIATDGSKTVSTLAGTGTPDFKNGIGTAAKFDEPVDVAVDSNGNIYVADYGNHRIRKITIATDGSKTVNTLAGTGTPGYENGDATTKAQFDNPSGVAVDFFGNSIYVADADNHRIRLVTTTGETARVSTLAGGKNSGVANDPAGGTNARFNAPEGVAVDFSGNVYVADTDNHLIRKIATAIDGSVESVSTLAGSTEGFKNGDGTAAQFDYPYRVAVDLFGNIYVADTLNHRIRKITIAADGTATVSTLAGGKQGFADGTGTAAQFDSPSGVAVDSFGNSIYVADTDNHRIRKIEYK